MANTKQIQWQFGILLSQSVLAIFVLIIFCLFIMVSNFCGLVVGLCLYVSCNFFKFWFVFVVVGGVLFYSLKRGWPKLREWRSGEGLEDLEGNPDVRNITPEVSPSRIQLASYRIHCKLKIIIGILL